VRRLVLLRHGRTEWNDTGRAQGHADVPLDDVGEVQAKAVAPVLAALAPAAVWSSDLARAAGTAAVVAAEAGLEPVLDARLREFDVGPHRVGLTDDQYAVAHPEEHAALVAGDLGAVPGRETPDDVLARFLPALTSYADALGEGETGIVVSHGRLPRGSAPRGGAGVPRLGGGGPRVPRRARQLRLGRARALTLDLDRRCRALAVGGLEPGRRVSDRAREVDVASSRRLARVMDDAVTVPGTSIGVGLDAVIGLVPGIGDAVGSALSGVIVRDAIRARVPMVVLAWMGLNLVVDALLGVVPGVGDLLDVVHRANRKNLRLLLREIERQPLREPPSAAYVVGAVALMLVPVLAGVVVTVLGIWLLVRWLS
jgi:glucosyl-3-phosphoglycerate phosphatase